MNKSELIHKIESYIPNGLLKLYRGSKRYMRREIQKVANKKALQKAKNKKGPLNVLFMATYNSTWKYDSLYQQMLLDPIFNANILVCPVVNRGKGHMIEAMHTCCKYFEQRGYTYIKTYDEVTNTYIDAHSFKPDIIFYTNPYKGLIDDKYYQDKFSKALTCYVNYAFNNHKHEWGFNLPFHQFLWRYYIECDSNLQDVKLVSPNKAANCVVTGYPMFDAFVNGTTTGKDWKLNDSQHKRIVWSPHHTIDGRDDMIKFSTFLLYYDKMLSFAERYKDSIEIAFKPHPLLKVNLYEHPEWGKERTDAYYAQWANGENTTLVDGDYIDLFKTSDAMINDSGSFLIEYLYTQKPCLYLNNYNRQEGSNVAALKALDSWYRATTEQEIEQFITDVVIEGKDTMEKTREAFYKEMLLPPNGCSVAENIVNDIKKALNKQI